MPCKMSGVKASIRRRQDQSVNVVEGSGVKYGGHSLSIAVYIKSSQHEGLKANEEKKQKTQLQPQFER